MHIKDQYDLSSHTFNVHKSYLIAGNTSEFF